ncbi:MAG: HyaD/HybD family hydrogenase maturation endopeptidase [Steroidobacteraceae bacterium]|nr:HyaD/HybD family hydrogenase maturation endopeptidase [Steroidobacteraceae bacterium]
MNDDNPAPQRRIVVLGVGNLLWADEGFGVRCVEALGDGYDVPADVAVMDGGTLGLALVPELLDATHVLLFDAVEHRGEPGSLVVARDDEVPLLMGGNKLSLHQVGVNDIFASLELLGHKPDHVTVVGIKPVLLADYGGSLTEPVRAQVPAALALGIEELRRWGVAVRERTGGPARDVVIGALSQDRYESGRPSADVACRVGDERFLAMRAAAAGRNDPPEGEST